MSRWLRRWTKLYHYHHPVMGIAGLFATVILARPGEHTFGVGPLEVDAFYASLIAFGALFVVGVIDTYDPEDYGLDTSDTED